MFDSTVGSSAPFLPQNGQELSEGHRSETHTALFEKPAPRDLGWTRFGVTAFHRIFLAALVLWFIYTVTNPAPAGRMEISRG